MRVIGLKILKNKLSEYVRLAAGGETVLVTDRDRVVAEIVPPHAGVGAHVSDAVLADMVRCGLMSPALNVTHEPPPRQPVAPLAEILAELRADRDAR
ncbi:MAG: type II toxin-antitoxin system Phd/YefM family antitoxin [Sulfuricaulis sp.]|nr:type II toxin-antitoxin system Phd/YefM family antitoxin [Sulfuricaulis sp.]